MIRDEPNCSDFGNLSKTVEALHEIRPGKLAYINLFPNYANEAQLGAPTYDEHVRRFVDEVKPDVLSMDHYPLLTPHADGRDNYCHNLDVMRRESLRKGIPFWNFFNTMPFGPHDDPTEGQLRWQIYTSLAFGAKGIMYFCYWTPTGGEFPKGYAIITAEGRKTRHYEQAKRINLEVKSMGPTLMKLTSTQVIRLRPEDDYSTLLAGTPIKSLSKGDYLIGVFLHSDGRRAILLNNYLPGYTCWPTVEFDVPMSTVREIDRSSGKEIGVIDDSPAMEGTQVSLDAGEGRLFLLPRKVK